MSKKGMDMTRKHTHRKGQHRDDLTGEHALGDAGQVAIACVFAATWILDSFFLKYTTFLNHYVPLGIRIAPGLLSLILSGYFATTGLSVVFGEKRDKPGVIRKSVFSLVRHPIYLGEIMFYLGLLILSISLAALLVWFVAILFLHYISRYEEKLLLARFGEEYHQYMSEVPMWIPRFWK